MSQLSRHSEPGTQGNNPPTGNDGRSMTERWPSWRNYKIFLRVVGLLPIIPGILTVTLGLERIPEAEILYPAVDSDLRFTAGVLTIIGVMIIYISFRAELYGRVLLFVFAGVLFGNLGRILSLVVLGAPGVQQYAIFGATVVAATIGFAWTWHLGRQGALA